MCKNKVLARFCKLALLCCAGLILYAHGAAAQMSASSIVELGPDTSSIAVGPYIYVTPDSDHKLSYNAIVSRHLNNIRGTRFDNGVVNLGMGPQPTWMVLTVKNNTPRTDWVLHFGQVFEGRYGTVKKLMVVDQSTNQIFTRALREKEESGGFGQDLNGPSLSIKLRPNETDMLVFYVEAEGGMPATFAPHLMTSKAFIDNLRFGDLPSLLAGIFFVSMIGFFIAVIYMERRAGYLFFLLYYFFLTALFFGLSSSFFATYNIMGEGLALLYVLAIASGLLITKFFLELSVEDHRENMLLSAAGAFMGFGAALSFAFFTDDMIINQLAILAPPLVGMAVIAFIAFLQAKQNKYGAFYFAIAWMMPFVGSVFVGVAALTPQPPVMFMNAFWISLLPQAVLFVIGTTKKIQMMDEEFRQEKIRESRMARSLARLKQSKESADQARLLRVIERERELMSELREREMQRTEEMRKAKEAADQANRAKSAFLAVVTHEIRTPMTGIMGMVRLLLDSKLGTKQNEYALAIQKSGDTMIALLNDILDFEKSKGGKMELELVDFDLLRLVQDVVLLMSGRTAEKSIFLKSDIDPAVPRYVRGDPARLRQILLNLVTNAIKFTAEGGVTIRVRATPVAGTNAALKGDYEIYFGIEDTGIGISEEAQTNLFIPFMQADSSTNRKYGGTGLGLAICKKLIEAMGGSIAVNSQIGAGSTFFFTLLMEKGDAEQAALADTPKNFGNIPSSLPAKDILVVEDNEMNRRVLQGLLEKYGHRVDMAKSGEEAIEKAGRKIYDLILMDIELPGMTGDETTRKLRQLPDRAAASMPVIALTGHVMMEDIERFYEANMNGHLAKPIQPEQLLEAIKHVHERNLENEIILPEEVLQDHAPSLQRASTKPRTPATDSMTPMQRFLAERSGNEDTEGDLEADSFEEATRAIEEEQKNQAAPDAAAPLNADLLNAEMLEGLRSALGNAQMEELLGGFFVTCDEIVAAIDAMAASGDTSQLQARAHELRGMAANFGVSGLGDSAAKIEKFMRDGQTEPALEEAKKLQGLAVQSRAALRAWMG